MSKTPALELRGIAISAGGRTICQDIDLVIHEGERHILLGPNGSGKSTLLNGIMGVTPFEITAGQMLFYGTDITELEIEERARLGIGLAFQRPPAIDGVKVSRLAAAIGAGGRVQEQAGALGLSALLDRNVNCGFSGGETKRFEVLKLQLQSPSLCLFDEPESGVDLEQVGVVGEAINELLETPDAQGRARCGLVITHTGFILDGIRADHAHLMIDGRIVRSGDPHDMFETIRRDGYRKDN